MNPGPAAAVWILAITAVIFLLRAAATLLIPVVLAVLISYALEPVVAWATRRRVPRTAAAGVLMALLVGASAWGVFSLRDDARQAFAALPEAAERVRDLVWSAGGEGPAGQLRRAARILQGTEAESSDSAATSNGQDGPAEASPRERTVARDPDADRGGSPDADDAADAADASPVPLGGSGALADLAQQSVGSLLAFAGHITVIVFLVFFLLSSGHHFRQRIIEIAGHRLDQRRVTARIVDEINAQIQRFLLVRLVTAAVVAAATWAALAWMDVPQAAVWGVLAGVFNSIPYFGPVIVSGGLLAVGLVQSGDFTRAVQMAGVALVITSLEGWLLTPPLLGKAERMHVLVVFLGLLLWTWIWGAWGTILAVPMLVVVKSVVDHVESLRPMSRLMAP